MENRLFKILRSVSTLIFLIIIFNTTTVKAQTADAPTGSGTSGDPYLIATLNNLYWVTQTTSSWNKYFLQTADIDASSTSGWGGGSGFSPIGNSTTQFTGTYDGDGHTITGIFINRSTVYIGLFGYTSGAIIKNIGLINADITGSDFVGGLVGHNADLSKLSNSHCAGSVSGSSNLVGGLVGYNNSSSTVSNCYSTASVSGIGSVGGLVGLNTNSALVSNSYSTGTVSGSSNFGGLIGENGASFEVSNCFWDKTTSGQTIGIGSGPATGATGKTTTEMKNAVTYLDAGWDAAIWNLGDGINNGYPYLDWQNTSGTSLIASLMPSGSGTSGDPYLISTLDNLYWITQNSGEWG